MIDNDLLEILRCPDDHSPLTPADAALVDKVNRAIRSGSVVNVGGNAVKDPIGGGLVRSAGDLLYPVVDNIPVMLYDEAIALASFRH